MTSFSRRQLETTIEWMIDILRRHGSTRLLAEEPIPHEVARVLMHYVERIAEQEKKKREAAARRARIRQAH